MKKLIVLAVLLSGCANHSSELLEKVTGEGRYKKVFQLCMQRSGPAYIDVSRFAVDSGYEGQKTSCIGRTYETTKKTF